MLLPQPCRPCSSALAEWRLDPCKSDAWHAVCLSSVLVMLSLQLAMLELTHLNLPGTSAPCAVQRGVQGRLQSAIYTALRHARLESEGY